MAIQTFTEDEVPGIRGVDPNDLRWVFPLARSLTPVGDAR